MAGAMNRRFNSALIVALVGPLWLAAACVADEHVQGSEATVAKAASPEVDKEEDEFYAHVDKVTSPTELLVTILDVWNPMDKLRGPRWPEGNAKVKPTKSGQ